MGYGQSWKNHHRVYRHLLSSSQTWEHLGQRKPRILRSPDATVFHAYVGIYLSSDRCRGEQEPYAVSRGDKKGKGGRSKTVAFTFTHFRFHYRHSTGRVWTSYDQLYQILVPQIPRGEENADRSSGEKLQLPLRYQVSDWYKNKGRKKRKLCWNNLGRHYDGQ